MRPEILELLSWIEGEPRAYPDAIEVWRTNCPQHSVWEDSVIVTSRGRAALDRV